MELLKNTGYRDGVLQVISENSRGCPLEGNCPMYINGRCTCNEEPAESEQTLTWPE